MSHRFVVPSLGGTWVGRICRPSSAALALGPSAICRRPSEAMRRKFEHETKGVSGGEWLTFRSEPARLTVSRVASSALESRKLDNVLMPVHYEREVPWSGVAERESAAPSAHRASNARSSRLRCRERTRRGAACEYASGWKISSFSRMSRDSVPRLERLPDTGTSAGE